MILRDPALRLDPRVRRLWALELLLVATATTTAAPGIAFDRFGYEVTDLGLYVASGIVWRRWQVVPHARVQTVDTRSGPLQRLFGVVSVAVTTASAEGGNEVPGLDPRVADTLVTELARRAGIEEGT